MNHRLCLRTTSPSRLTRCHCPGCGSQCLLRCRSHPAGRGPNSSSLFPPLAAVVAVAPCRRGFGSPRKVNGFARGSPTRGAGAQRLRGCTKTGLPSVARPALLRHIGNAPVHWHEETFSSGGILLSDENATVFLTSSDLQPVAPTQIATLNAICFFFDRIKIFQASIPQAERISYTVLFHALPVTLLSEDYRGQ